jgi:hypothetical protein
VGLERVGGRGYPDFAGFAGSGHPAAPWPLIVPGLVMIKLH